MILKAPLLRCCYITAVALFFCPKLAFGQDTLRINKVITNSQLVGIGSVNALDTYLSAETYTGKELRYISHSTRENPTRWSRALIHQAEIFTTHNRSDNNNILGGFYNFQYNWQYRLLSAAVGTGSIKIKVGGGIDSRLGFMYNTRNSNNPAQAYGQLNIAPNAEVAYHFRLWKRPFQLRYELQIPLTGLMFSPNYGQSYYEIFSKGDYDHNLVITTPFSSPSLRHTLSFDFTLRHTTIRIGYLGDYQQAKVNGLKQHVWSHLGVIGIVRKFSINKILP